MCTERGKAHHLWAAIKTDYVFPLIDHSNVLPYQIKLAISERKLQWMKSAMWRWCRMSQPIPLETNQQHLKQACQRKQLSSDAGPGRHSVSVCALAVRRDPRLSDLLTGSVKGQQVPQHRRQLLRVSHMGHGGNTKEKLEHTKHSLSITYGQKVH